MKIRQFVKEKGKKMPMQSGSVERGSADLAFGLDNYLKFKLLKN